MGQYSKKGLYSSYDKNNKERQAEDYYATPPSEVENILSEMNIVFENDDVILEPCCGGGYMICGIIDYLLKQNEKPYIIGTDIKDRGYRPNSEKLKVYTGVDVLTDDYGVDFPPIDYVIMNPPFSLIEPFVIRMLEIARKGVLMFGRIQFLEGKSRYENILKNNPPDDVYIYVDRVKCYKNADFDKQGDRIQCYAWFYWNKNEHHTYDGTKVHWIRRNS